MLGWDRPATVGNIVRLRLCKLAYASHSAIIAAFRAPTKQQRKTTCLQQKNRIFSI